MEHCGIDSWTSNSRIVHDTSSDGATFSRRSVVFPAFSHEPNVIRAPGGEWVMYFTSSPPGKPPPPPCDQWVRRGPQPRQLDVRRRGGRQRADVHVGRPLLRGAMEHAGAAVRGAGAGEEDQHGHQPGGGHPAQRLGGGHRAHGRPTAGHRHAPRDGVRMARRQLVRGALVGAALPGHDGRALRRARGPQSTSTRTAASTPSSTTRSRPTTSHAASGSREATPTPPTASRGRLAAPRGATVCASMTARPTSSRGASGRTSSSATRRRRRASPPSPPASSLARGRRPTRRGRTRASRCSSQPVGKE